MKRTLLIVLLGLGTLVGFGGGCASMHARGHHRHARFENRVAEVCAAAAHRVYDQRSGAPTQASPTPPTTVVVPWNAPIIAVPATPTAPPAAAPTKASTP